MQAEVAGGNHAAHTPVAAGSQMYLCIWICMRTWSRSAMIHCARSSWVMRRSRAASGGEM